jgi:outer membrane protein OmpA-like peptidoglycan-associated protein
MEGLVYDARTKRPIGGQFELIDLATGITIISADADKLTGEFLVSLPTKRDYVINVSYPNYNFYSLNFSLKNDEQATSFKLDIPLEPMEEDATVRLENVFFDLGTSTLRPESRIELDKLVAQLVANPTVKIEIGGHTDSRGNPQENLALSQSRAKAVLDYLVAKGIDSSRLMSKGYASTKPVFTDAQIAELKDEKEREKAHQTNRRTEYKIIAK